MTKPVVYLASQSPRRSQLLDQLGVPHQLLLPDADEDAEALEAVLPGEAPARYVVRVTGLKRDAAVARHRRLQLPPGIIVCADTTVALGRQILGKPAGDAQARAMLRALAGRTHRVLTAVAVARGRRQAQALSASRVAFAPMGAATIKAYVASGEPMGKAGAYAIQGGAGAFVRSISGSYSGIMGLPLFETAQLLRGLRHAI
ncbi:MAG: Maf family protein [Burkholderiaceae bacterium]